MCGVSLAGGTLLGGGREISRAAPPAYATAGAAREAQGGPIPFCEGCRANLSRLDDAARSRDGEYAGGFFRRARSLGLTGTPEASPVTPVTTVTTVTPATPTPPIPGEPPGAPVAPSPRAPVLTGAGKGGQDADRVAPALGPRLRSTPRD